MKTSLTLCALGVLLLGRATSMQAQAVVTFGPRLGGNLATATFNSLDELASSGISFDHSKSPIVAPQLGMVVNMQWGNWSFQPAVLFSQKGLKQHIVVNINDSGYNYHEDASVTSRVNYLELPLNVVYTFGGDQGFQVFAGPYLAVGVGGKASYRYSITSNAPGGLFDNYSENGAEGYTFASEFEDPSSLGSNGNSTSLFATARRFDAGVNAGVGYHFGPVQAQLGYGLGLLNVQPDYPASYQMSNDTGYHRVLQLTATYFLTPR